MNREEALRERSAPRARQHVSRAATKAFWTNVRRWSLAVAVSVTVAVVVAVAVSVAVAVVVAVAVAVAVAVVVAVAVSVAVVVAVAVVVGGVAAASVASNTGDFGAFSADASSSAMIHHLALFRSLLCLQPCFYFFPLLTLLSVRTMSASLI